MADILTFRHKNGALSDECIPEDSDKTLPFRKTPEGGFDLDKTKMPWFEKNLAQTSCDWSNQELATLFRVKHLLGAAGIFSDTDRGLSDEGDPWFVFCHGDGEVFIHFCRIDAFYLLDSPSLDQPLRGHDFEALISDFTRKALPGGTSENSIADTHRVVRLERSGNIRLHPSTLLAALVWTLFLASEELVLVVQDSQNDGPDANPSSDALIAFDGIADKEALEANTSAEALLGANNSPAVQDHQAVVPGQANAAQKDILSQTGIAITPNSYVVGLSSIAIALGLISESRLSESAQDLLDEIESALAFLDNSLSAKGDDPAISAAEAAADALLELINLFDDPSALEDVHEGMLTTLEDDQDTKTSNFIVTYEGEIETAASDAKTVVDIPKEALRTASQERDEFQDLSYSLPEMNANPGDDANLAALSIQNIEELLQIFDTPLKSFVLEGETVFASFNLLEVTTSEPEPTGTDTVSLASDGTMSNVSTTIGSLAPLPEAADRSVRTLIDTAVSIAVETQNIRTFDEGAAEFIYFILDRIERIEVIRTERDYVFLDFDSFLDAQGTQLHVMSWSLDDGGVVATVGLRSDFESFDLIA